MVMCTPAHQPERGYSRDLAEGDELGTLAFPMRASDLVTLKSAGYLTGGPPGVKVLACT